MQITLFRGITVKPEDEQKVRETILSEGLSEKESQNYTNDCIDLRSRIDELFEKPDLTTEDTRPSRWIETDRGGYSELIGGYPIICACADRLGANYYAQKHNQYAEEGLTKGLVIKFRADIDDLQIDGRDFLYNFVFQANCNSKQQIYAYKLFGDSLRRYLERAIVNSDHDYKIAMCDLAVQDAGVISSHAKNEIIIGGRHGTVFRSAFFVKTPILPSDILEIEETRNFDFTPQITIEEFRRMGE